MAARTFTGELARNERGGTALTIPFDVAAVFGKARAPVRATINGFSFRTRTMRYGGVYLLGLNRRAREGAGADAGDTVTVRLELDDAPREVHVPDDLAAALATEPELGAFFHGLSFTNRKEYVRSIEEARTDETRRRRLAGAVELLRSGTKHP